MEKLQALRKVARAFGFIEQDSIIPERSPGKGATMTDAGVKKLVSESVAEAFVGLKNTALDAIATMKKARCPHCNEVIGAAKVAKSKSVSEDFFDTFYGGAPLQSASGGLFDSGPSAKLTKADNSPSGGLFDK